MLKSQFSSALIAMILAVPSTALSEIVTTTDGRSFDLKDDGTFTEVLQEGLAHPLESSTDFFEQHTTEYQQEFIRFMPTFKNTSDKTVIGTKFRTKFENAFGDEIFSFEGETTEKVAPGDVSSAKVFYAFENNPFIGDEPYDKMLPMAVNGAGKIRTVFTDVAFDDGTVARFE